MAGTARPPDGVLVLDRGPEVGRVTSPSSPLRFEGAPASEIVPSSPHNGDEAEVLGGMLGLSDAEREALRASGALGPGSGAG